MLLLLITNPIYAYREAVGKYFTSRDVGQCRLIGQRSEHQLAGGVLIDAHKDREPIRFPLGPQGGVFPVQSGSIDSCWRDIMLVPLIVNEKGRKNLVLLYRDTIGRIILNPTPSTLVFGSLLLITTEYLSKAPRATFLLSEGLRPTTWLPPPQRGSDVT